jgi:hypothetical protein
MSWIYIRNWQSPPKFHMKLVYTQFVGATHWACSQKSNGFPQSPMKAHNEQISIFFVVILKETILNGIAMLGFCPLVNCNLGTWSLHCQ